MAAILETGTELISNSESPCHPSSHQVLAQSDLQFGRRSGLKNFKTAGHLGYWNRTIVAILNLHNTPMPLIKFKLNLTYHLAADVIKNFQDGCHGCHFRY